MKLLLAIAVLLAPAALLAQADTTHHARRAESGGGEHGLRAAQVPAPVRAAFHRDHPHAVVRGYSTELEGGRRIYEVESREGRTGIDASFAADGTLLETETSLPVSALPAAVRTAITTQAGHARIRSSERSVAGADTVYEFSVQGRRGEVRLKPDGSAAPPEQQ